MLTIEGYTIQRLLRQGKRFNIYRAIRTTDNRSIILKACRHEQPSAKELSTLQHEYALLKELESINVIRAYKLLKQDRQLIIELEDIGGIDLQEFIVEHPCPLDSFFTIALQIVEALSILHAQNIIHKDINPSNIIINPKTLTAKLIDLGISIQLEQEMQDNTLLKELEGTLAYISPEQTGRMNRALDYRSDFYSLGVTFYEMLTGELPFNSADTLELIHHHIAKKPVLASTINSAIPKQLALIIDKLLAKAPEERYVSTSGIKADLLECQRQWQANKSINPFELGQQDVHNHLNLSQKLYGRQPQLAELISAYNRICQGNKELLLITGYSGIGKTSLVKELYKPITQHKGYFISGKYDQLKRSTPYSAFVEAFEDLMRRFLAEPKEQLEQIKQNILNAIGNNGQVIISVIPSVKNIIGEQPIIPELPPMEAQNRFMLTFQNFVRILARPEHPLTLFIDDLQWIDGASLNLLRLLLSDKLLKNILFIGSYRNNEVSDEHPLSLVLQDLQKQHITCNTLSLTPLKLIDIQELLADSFSYSIEDTLPLAKLLLAKTEGNPFFVNEFIKKLYQDKLLTFSHEHYQWQWNLESVSQQNMTDNVIDLLTIRIRQLPTKTQDILKLAACIGHIFDIHTLVKISGYSLIDTIALLQPTINNNLLFIVNGEYKTISSLPDNEIIDLSNKAITYRFAHDKIQHSAYQLIEESQRKSTHLSIGRLLIKDNPLDEQSKYLFDVLNHFNKALILLSDPNEKRNIAKANLWATNKAKIATAYDAAKEYCRAGISLLDVKPWENDYELIFGLYKELMECEYLTGNHEVTAALFQELLPKAKTLDDKVAIYQIQISMINTKNKAAEALAIGLEALKVLGINFPINPNKFDIIKLTLLIKSQLKIHQLKGSKLPLLTDKRIIHIHLLLRKLINSAVMINPALFMLLVAYEVYAILKYGFFGEAANALLSYGYIIIHNNKRFKDGFDLIKLHKELKEQYPTTHTKTHIEDFVRAYFIEYLTLPINDSIDKMKNAIVCSLEQGDLAYANYNYGSHITYQVHFGKPLSTIDQGANNYAAFIERNKITNLSENSKALLMFAKHLASQDAQLPQFVDIKTTVAQYTNKFTAAIVSSQYMLLYTIFNHYQEVAEFYDTYKTFKVNFSSVEYKLSYFYYAICLAAIALEAPTEKRMESLKQFNQPYKEFKLWANEFPINLRQYGILLDALNAQINNNSLLAITLYKDAVHESQKNDHLLLVALACEFATSFYLSIDQALTAKAYIQVAHYNYSEWGAKAKVKQLERKYPEWFQDDINIISLRKTAHTVSTSTTTTFGSIDTLSIFKSAQVLSSEIELEQLLRKLLSILLENAGSQRITLLSKSKEQWFIEAEGSLDMQDIYLDLSKQLDEQKNLPLALLNYAERTQELVLIQNAKEYDGKYQQDSYLMQEKPQSMLVLPILHQSQLKYLLYFENKSVSHAFTPESINTLQLLASQAAISLENAKLYRQATHDGLTGLANRSLLQQVFSQVISRSKGKTVLSAILFLDLDGFKQINDTLGHEIGDRLLINFAQLLKQSIRNKDLAVRLGGDEFIIMLEDIANIQQVERIAKNILQQLTIPVEIAGHPIVINTSIGISLYPNNGADIETLLKRADTALYNVKTAGKGQYQFYPTEIT